MTISRVPCNEHKGAQSGQELFIGPQLLLKTQLRFMPSPTCTHIHSLYKMLKRVFHCRHLRVANGYGGV